MDSLHKETEQEQKELVKLCGKLGREAMASGGGNFPENPELVTAVSEARAEYDKCSMRLASLKEAVNEITESDNTISKVKVRLKELEAQKVRMLSVLGAVSAEIYDGGFFPDELDFALDPLRAYREREARVDSVLEPSGKNSGSSLKRFFYAQKKKKLDKQLEEVYLEIGKLISQSGECTLLSSPRVEAIFIELGNIDRVRENLNSEINRRSEKINIARTSLEEQGQNVGINNLRLREVELECDRLGDVARQKEEEYGQFLANNMDKWLNEDCSMDILKCCDDIRRQKKRLYLQQLHARLLSFEKAIEICDGRISQYRDRITYLDSQIAGLQSQRADMEAKIATEQQNIESCQIQQKAIKTLAKEAK